MEMSLISPPSFMHPARLTTKSFGEKRRHQMGSRLTSRVHSARHALAAASARDFYLTHGAQIDAFFGTGAMTLCAAANLLRGASAPEAFFNRHGRMPLWLFLARSKRRIPHLP
jgi:hypothetical protein